MVASKLYELYKSSGILVRGNDGQTPYTNCDVVNAISNIKISDKQVLTDFLQNESPPYSASLLTGVNNNPPILWYNYDFVEAFKDSTVNEVGNRTIVAAVFRNGNIVVRGGCVWDADSNLRDLGNIPNTNEFNKATPGSLFAELNVFNNIGGFKAPQPTTNNNNPTYNPLFRPRTNSALAQNYNEVNNYLYWMGKYKSTWVDTLKKDAGGYNNTFGEYLSNNYGTGLEPEILVEPKNNQPYYEKKFDLDEILCVGFFTDRKSVKNTKGYIKTKNDFLNSAMAKGGWVNCGNPNKIPTVLVTNVALPNVPISGTAAAKGNVGLEWVTYLNSGYDKALTKCNFTNI